MHFVKQASIFLCWIFVKNIIHVQAIGSSFDVKQDGFKKHWKLYDIFLPCTIHFTRAPESWLDMHDSFLERCVYVKYCVTLQTAYPYQLRDESFGKVLLETWNITSEVNVTQIFRKVFGPHHFHDVCFVRIAFSSKNSTNTLKEYDRGGWGERLMLPSRNYIIFPIVFERNRDNSPEDTIIAPFLGRSKLLCLNQNDASVFMTCLTCLERNTIFYERVNYFSKKLAVFRRFPTVLDDVDALWNFFPFQSTK